MAIKTFKPTTPSRRHMTVSAFEGIVLFICKAEGRTCPAPTRANTK